MISMLFSHKMVEMDKEWLALRRTQSLKFLKENLNLQ